MDIFELLSLRGTRKILGELGERGAVKYSELVRAVGFSTTTTRALKRMEQLGIVEKKVLAEPYRPVAYSLTEKGRRLAEIVKKLDAL
jgi:DNA-binding HxlR family transcriptional regulator